MSILIKNMKMPQNCGECPLYGHLSIHENTFRFCRLTRMETRPMGRRNDCPLIEEPPRGKWEKHNDGIMYWWECSECHLDDWYDDGCDLFKYCPSCGAKMVAVEEG